MLEPSDLVVLGEQLAPPAGYEADALVAATYSLDLPLAFALPLAVIRQGRFAGETAESADRYATLEAIRRLTPRFRVFCDAGGLLPGRPSRTLDLLTDVVVPVSVPQEEKRKRRPTFHPKFVVARYVQPDRPTRMRLLCMSRNLTGDAALDASAVLEGEIRQGAATDQGSDRLANSIARLLAWTVNPEQEERSRTLLEDLAGSVRNTTWQIPAGFRRVAIWPLGFDADGPDPICPRDDERRVLIMSPFLGEKRLNALSEATSEATLISDSLALDAIPRETLKQFTNKRLDPLHAPGNGLHAKLYIAEGRHHKRWLIGSANATNAAVERNAELMIELEAGRSGPGIDDLLDIERGIGSILCTYEADGDMVPRPEDSRAEQILWGLAACQFIAVVRPEDSRRYRIEIRVDPPLEITDGEVFVSLRGGPRAKLHPEQLPGAVLAGIPRNRLSRYLNVEVRATDTDRHDRLVVMTMDGVDLNEIAREALTDCVHEGNADPLAYLHQALTGGSQEVVGLSFDEDALEGPDGGKPNGNGGRPQNELRAIPLLEPLLAALENGAEDSVIADASSLIASLRSEMPADFLELWDTVETVVERRRTR